MWLRVLNTTRTSLINTYVRIYRQTKSSVVHAITGFGEN